MAKNDKRPIIKLRSTAGTGYTYVTTKNKRTKPEKIEIMKFDPVARKHVAYKETKIKSAHSHKSRSRDPCASCHRPLDPRSPADAGLFFGHGPPSPHPCQANRTQEPSG